MQQNFGEHPSSESHGYLLWEIEDRDNFKTTEVWVDNPYNFVNLKICENYNYEMIDLDNQYITPESQIKVKWHDYSANINFENEMKIRQYIKDKWSIDKVKFERENIYTDVSEVEMVNENINVLNSNEQREIFIEFLKTNKHPKKFIDDVIKIDEIINDRLNEQENNGVSWSIDKYWFNNFKSYGDGNFIDWEEQNGIYQIHGENQKGKSTIIDAISWILYGKTTNTMKRERHGDNRFFNNKRERDTLDGGAVITINGQKYTIIREYSRKWTKAGDKIASITANVEYFIGDDPNDDTLMSEEQRRDTQKLIENTIGDFDDFLRLVLTTADNLNSLLSMDRANFMDSLIKDAGFDIFDKKLTEFKEYRKEIQEKRKNIDIDVVESEIERITQEKKDKEIVLTHVSSVIDELIETQKLQNQIREEKIKQLDKIDDELKNLDVQKIEHDIDSETINISQNQIKLESIDRLKEEISEYDSSILEDKEIRQDELNETITNARLGQSEYEKKISESNSEIKLLNIDIDNIVNNYTSDLSSKNKDLDMEIMKIKEDFVANINDYLASANQKVSEVVEKQNDVHTDIDRLMEEGKKLKHENHELENSTSCITCKRPLEDVDMAVIEEKISGNRDKMTEIMNKVGELKPIHEKIGTEVEAIRDKILKIKDKDYSFDTELLNTYNESKERIKTLKGTIEENNKTIELVKGNNIPVDLKDLLGPSYKRKSELTLYISDLEKELDTITKDLSKKEEELETLRGEISKLKVIDEEIDEKKERVANETKVSMDIEMSKNRIKDYQKQIEDYKSTLEKIENNKKIEEEIEGLDEILSELNDNISEKTDEKMNYHSSIKLFENQLEQYEEDKITYEKNKKQDEIMSTYMKCVHRDGLPTYLLKKSIHIINQELSKILTDVDFTVYFDSDLNLKLSADNRLDIAQNAIESSGMERTFTAVALKIALRKVNNKSKPNFILLDEIMGKLISESVEMFIKLLDNIKQDVDKLVIIEHIHPINYDVLIEVEKDIEGISSLNVDI